jgi:hypothetical protein
MPLEKKSCGMQDIGIVVNYENAGLGCVGEFSH